MKTALTEVQSRVVVEKAKDMIFATRDWASTIHEAGSEPACLSIFARLDLANGEYLSFLDAMILKALKALKKGIERPMAPLVEAVWTLSLSIPGEEIGKTEERALAFLMRRIDDTAQVAREYNEDKGSYALQNELRKRGFWKR